MLVDVNQRYEFTIAGISHAENEGGYIVLLESEYILKKIPINVGIKEGQAIAMALESFQTPRPMIHHLMLNMIRDLKHKVKEVVVYRLFEGVFFSKIVLSPIENKALKINQSSAAEAAALEIDARTSDAIVIAILANCPLYITSEIVESVGFFVEKEADYKNYKNEDDVEFYGLSIEDLEKELKKNILREEYEIASRIRDRIQFLKNKKA